MATSNRGFWLGLGAVAAVLVGGGSFVIMQGGTGVQSTSTSVTRCYAATSGDGGVDYFGCGQSEAQDCHTVDGCAASVGKNVRGPVQIIVGSDTEPRTQQAFTLSGITVDMSTWRDAGFLDAGYLVICKLATVTDAGGTMTGTFSKITSPARPGEMDLAVDALPFVADSLEGFGLCDLTKNECQPIRANDAGSMTTAITWPVTPVAGDSFAVKYPTTVFNQATPYPFGLGTSSTQPARSSTSTLAEVWIGGNTAPATGPSARPTIGIQNCAFETAQANASGIVVVGSTQNVQLENVFLRNLGTSAVRTLDGAKVEAYGLSCLNNQACFFSSGLDVNQPNDGSSTIINSVLRTSDGSNTINLAGGIGVYGSLLHLVAGGTGIAGNTSGGVATLNSITSKTNHYIFTAGGSAVGMNGSSPFLFFNNGDEVVGATNGFLFAGPGEATFTGTATDIDTTTTAIGAKEGAHVRIVSGPGFTGAGVYQIGYSTYATTAVSGTSPQIICDGWDWSCISTSNTTNNQQTPKMINGQWVVPLGIDAGSLLVGAVTSGKGAEGLGNETWHHLGDAGVDGNLRVCQDAGFGGNVNVAGVLTVGSNVVDSTPAESAFSAYDSIALVATTGALACKGVTTSAMTLRSCNYVPDTAPIGSGTETLELCDGTGITTGNCTGTKFCTVALTSGSAAGASVAGTVNTSAVAAAANPCWVIVSDTVVTSAAKGNVTAAFTTP